MAVPPYTQEQFACGLRQGSPWKVHLFGTVSSTMDEARRLAEMFPDEGFVVAVADRQTAGVGRQGRAWASPSEGLWMTALLRPALSPDCASQFTLVAAVAVAESLQAFGYPVGIKWPNDVLVSRGPFARRKLSGIRAEMHAEAEGAFWVSLGIGLNVHQAAFSAELESVAASLAQLEGDTPTRASCACAILDRLEELCAIMEADGFAAVRDRWLALALGLGQAVTVSDAGGSVSGVMEGLDEDGHLILGGNGQTGPQRIVSGDLVFEV